MDLLDLRKLSDLDFESLCKDIFERLLGVRLEIFQADRTVESISVTLGPIRRLSFNVSTG